MLEECEWTAIIGVGITVESDGHMSKEVIAELDLMGKEGKESLTMEVVTCSNK